ncbi:MAG: efflux RND transporter periplasmic adaptor subunit [Sphingomonadales bacterium]|nr:efflux RND transporter periplasmic adaptor subunit [Sphingomonadales bacterium]
MNKFGPWIKRHPIWAAVIGLLVVFVAYKILVPTPPEYEYEVEAADRGEVVRTVSASGKLRALNTIKVGSEISGQVTNVYVDFNTPVTAGQVLAEIDATRPRARVQQAQAQVGVARAALAQADAAIIRARTDVEVQQRQYARSQELIKQGFVSKAALDQAQNALSTARAALSTALAQAASARAQISQSNAELSSAQLDLSRTRIVAPASGVVIDKLVEPGQTVAASFQTPNLFEIAADTAHMQVEAAVDEADIGQIRTGQPVRFTVDSYPDEKFEAIVGQVRKSANETANVVSYLVILDVDNKDGKLLTGMTANVEIVTGRRTKVVRVPAAAMRFRPRASDRPDGYDKAQEARAKAAKGARQTRGGEVWVVGEDPYKPKPRKVMIGLEGEDHVEIVKGLKPGEKVLVRSKTLTGDDADEDDADASAE